MKRVARVVLIALGLVALVWLAGTVLNPALLASAVLADEPQAREWVETGHFKQARAVLEPRVAAHPDDAEALWLLSRVKSAFGDPDAALPLAERAATLDPKRAEFHELLAELYGTRAEHAGPLKQFGLARRFKKEAETSVALDPQQMDARYALMLYYWKAPGFIGGDKNKAREIVVEMVRLNPREGHLAEARLAIESGDTTKVESFYRAAIAADPKSYEAHIALANHLISSRKMDAAESEAREAARLEPHRAGAFAVLAGLFAHFERWSALDSVLAEAETNVPNNLNPCYQAGRVLVTEKRDPARAERYFRRYVASEPEGGAPSIAHARWRLGQALEQQGRKSEAIAELETAVHLKPDFDDAKKDLKRLR